MSLENELYLDSPFTDVRHEAVLNVVRTASLLTNVGASLFRRYDLTEAQFGVLFALKYKGVEVTQTDLGRRLVVTRASITSVLDKLEDKGLVERKRVEGNRRIHHVELTKKGQELINKAEPVYRAAVHHITDVLGEKDCRALIRSLERLRVCLRRSADDI